MSFPEFRVQYIPETFTKKIKREHDDQNGDPRDESQPRGIENEIFTVGKDVAPSGMGRWNAEPEKAQAGLRQNGGSDTDGGRDQHRGDGIGHHVPKDDPEVAEAQCLCRRHKVLFPQGEKFSADKSRGVVPCARNGDIREAPQVDGK